MRYNEWIMVESLNYAFRVDVGFCGSWDLGL
jgi:hypothetical protein